MRILYVADGHSPIARGWIEDVARAGHDVALVTTHPCAPLASGDVLVHEVLVGFSGVLRDRAASGAPAPGAPDAAVRGVVARLLRGSAAMALRDLRRRLAAFEVRRHRARCAGLIAELRPDLVHAMRLTFEGALAALAVPDGVPLVVSLWGNELTLHAHGGRETGRLIRRTLARADALLTDCQRDRRLAVEEWGFSPAKPAQVLPGAGGVDVARFHGGAADPARRRALGIPAGAAVVINPRGLRSYVCSEEFYRAMAIVLRDRRDVWVLAPGTADSEPVERWTHRLGIADRVVRLPAVPQPEMAELFGLARVTVSPTLHDGTPNTLLEAMACGCLPVAGDIESVREWIRPGENGLLCDPRDAAALAQAILRGLEDDALCARARAANAALIHDHARREAVMARAVSFYGEVAGRDTPGAARALAAGGIGGG